MLKRGRRHVGIVVAMGLLANSSCRKSKPAGVEFHSETHEEMLETAKEVFVEGDSGSVEVPEGVDDFFLRFARATRSEADLNATDFFSVPGMIQALDSGGMLEGLDSRVKGNLEESFRKSLAPLGVGLKQSAFDDHRVLRVEVNGENDYVVFVRQYDNELNISTQMRWWLLRTDEGWKAYDLEDLSMGIRMVSLMGAVMMSGSGSRREPWVVAILPLVAAIQTSDLTDPDDLLALQEPLEDLRKESLPIEVERFASAMQAGIHLEQGESQECIRELKESMEGGYESPIYHYLMGQALSQEEKFEEALAEFGKHAKRLGWDSDILELVSDCHFNLGQVEEARAAALRGLDDNQNSVLCLASLAASSSPEQIREEAFEDRFFRCEDPEWGYEVALDYLLELELEEQSESLLALFRKKYKDSELLEYYDEALEETFGDEPEEELEGPDE